MRDIVIASANRDAAERVRSILQSEGLMVSNIFGSGSDVLSFASIRPDAVIICGKLSDMAPVTLARLIPNGFDMVWLLSYGQAVPLYASNVVILNMPLDRREFTSTVRNLAFSGSQSFDRSVKRNEEDENILLNAKTILMKKNNISEREAHRLIQKRSMDKGISLILVAKKILEELA